MKLIALTIMLTSQFALADGMLKCSSPVTGPNDYSYSIEMDEGFFLTILQKSKNARYAPLKFGLTRADINEVEFEAVKFECSKSRRDADMYRFTLSVTANYLVLTQSSRNARYEAIAYKLLK